MFHNSLMRLVLFAIMSFYAVGSAGAQTSINSLLTPFSPGMSFRPSPLRW